MMDVIEEKENKLYCRKEVTAEFDGRAGTVSRKQALQELKKKYGDTIVIEKIEQKFGNKTVLVKARVYPDAEKAGEFEPKWRMARGLAEKKPAAGGK